MVKKLLFLLLISSFAMCQKQKVENQIILNNLKILNFWMGSSNPIVYKVVENEFRTYEYDENGNPTVVIDKPGQGGNSYWLKYDDLGRVIEERIKHTYINEIQDYIFEYNQNNDLLNRIHINKANIIEKNIYDSANRITEIFKGNRSGQLVQNRKYFYDREGRLLKEVFYNDSGVIDSETLFNYDNHNRLTHEDYNLYGKDETIEGRGIRAYKYDKFGNKVEFSHTHRGVLINITTYEYDGFHNISKESKFDPGSHERQTKVYFYEHKRAVRIKTQVFTENDGTVGKLTYEYYNDFIYDVDGNKIIEIHRDASFTEESRSTFKYKKISFE